MQLIESLFRNSVGLNVLGLALGSALGYMLLANLAWRITLAPGSVFAGPLRAAAARRAGLALYELARLVYYVGIPFAALYDGLVDLRAMGLGFFDWADGTRWTIVIILASWVLLLISWLPYLRVTADVPAPPAQRGLTLARRLVEMIYRQAHWSFYRAAAIMFLTGVTREALYWGTVLGVGLILLEAFADPRVRRYLTRVGEADLIVWNAELAIVNAIGFIVTRNLLLLLLIHLILEFTVPHLRPNFETARNGSPARR